MELVCKDTGDPSIEGSGSCRTSLWGGNSPYRTVEMVGMGGSKESLLGRRDIVEVKPSLAKSQSQNLAEKVEGELLS